MDILTATELKLLMEEEKARIALAQIEHASKSNMMVRYIRFLRLTELEALQREGKDAEALAYALSL